MSETVGGDRRRNISSDNGDNRGNISVGDVRCGSRSKDTSHSSSRNMVETDDGDYKSGYRYQTSHSSSNNPGDNVILLRIHSFIDMWMILLMKMK